MICITASEVLHQVFVLCFSCQIMP